MSDRGGELPEFLNAGTCSWNLFATLGVYPALGRLFTRDDDHTGAGSTVILSWSFFERRFVAILEFSAKRSASTAALIR